MAFCTNCGGNVTGTFCSQCGTPAASAGATPPPQAPPYAQQAPPYAQQAPPYAQQATPYAPPVVGGPMPPRKTSPIVWVLVIVVGLFVLGGIAVVGGIAFFAHRVHQAVSFDRGSDGNISIRAHNPDGKGGSIEIGTSSKLPSWVPAYPGATPRGTFAVKGSEGEGGNFTFETSDSADKVKAFYTEKCTDLGMKVNLETNSSDGGMFVAADEGGEHRSLTVAFGGSSGNTTVNVTYGRK